MKILFISPSYYPHIGGVEYTVKSVAERLARMGHEVTVLTGEPSIDKPRKKQINGVRVVRWPTWSPGEAISCTEAKNGTREKIERAC